MGSYGRWERADSGRTAGRAPLREIRSERIDNKPGGKPVKRQQASTGPGEGDLLTDCLAAG